MNFGINTATDMSSGMLILFLILAVWSIFWKGIALWSSAKENSKYWFILILLLNTAGVLEIIYIFFFSKKGSEHLKNLFKKNKKIKMHDEFGDNI